MAFPLTPREGRDRPQGPYEGVPGHLREPLLRWFRNSISDTSSGEMHTEAIEHLLLQARVAIPDGTGGGRPPGLLHIEMMSEDEPEDFLDVIHTIVQLRSGDLTDLHTILEIGHSAWSVAETGLVRRLDPPVQAAFDKASAKRDKVSIELAQAWAEAYGRSPDASDAWDHAIKAVEAILIPIVVPDQAGPHLGHVLGQLDRHADLWDTGLRFNQTTPPTNPPQVPVQALVGLLRLIYPNPDRHVGPTHRTPSLDEARVVVQLAVTIVQWAREGLIRKL